MIESLYLFMFLSEGHDLILQRNCKHRFECGGNFIVCEADAKRSLQQAASNVCFFHKQCLMIFAVLSKQLSYKEKEEPCI